MLTPHHPDLCAANRVRFLAALGTDAALFFSAPHHLRNGDAEYRYRQSSDILWLTGWQQPDCAVLFRPGAEHPFVMFVAPRDPERETWTGRRPGPEGAMSDYGVDQAWPMDELDKKLPGLLQGFRTLHYRFADNPENDRRLARAIATSRRTSRRTHADVPDAFVDPGRILHELRLRKSAEELGIMRTAGEITRDAHIAAMALTAPGVHEFELEAEINRVFRTRGGSGPGYTSIVGGGANAVILHYVENDAPLQDGDLVCVDAGCEFQGYTADVTRTWPVNGRFTAPQRALYELVLDAQKRTLDLARPGVKWTEIHDTATRILVEGMVGLGLLPGPAEGIDADAHVAQIIKDGTHKKYYMHGTGHWLGMDVHDVGAYNRDGEPIALEPGMCFTVEPGLYIPPEDEDAPPEFRGLGIRIEDDVVVTEGEPWVLTAGTPKEVDEVEAAVGRARGSAAAR